MSTPQVAWLLKCHRGYISSSASLVEACLVESLPVPQESHYVGVIEKAWLVHVPTALHCFGRFVLGTWPRVWQHRFHVFRLKSHQYQLENTSSTLCCLQGMSSSAAACCWNAFLHSFSYCALQICKGLCVQGHQPTRNGCINRSLSDFEGPKNSKLTTPTPAKK